MVLRDQGGWEGHSERELRTRERQPESPGLQTAPMSRDCLCLRTAKLRLICSSWKSVQLMFRDSLENSQNSALCR